METTSTDKTAGPDTEAGAETEPGLTKKSAVTSEADRTEAAAADAAAADAPADVDTGDAEDTEDETGTGYADADDADDASEPAAPSPLSAILTGAAAVTGAALALSSVTGTWLSNVVSQRQGLIGQIKTSGGTPKAQIAAGYGTPWHAIALVNGIFAVVALIVCGAVLLHPASRARAARGHWSQALAWGGLILAVIGLLIAGAMWFDVFAGLPAVPATPAAPAS